jgi:hypothetical protein
MEPCLNSCPKAEEVATHAEAITNLQGWQARQNGTLQRLEEKIDGVRTWLMSALLAAIVAILSLAAVGAQIMQQQNGQMQQQMQNAPHK